MIGWDVAITPDGPLVIEGNGRGSIGSIDIVYGGLKKHPVFNEILEKHTSNRIEWYSEKNIDISK